MAEPRSAAPVLALVAWVAFTTTCACKGDETGKPKRPATGATAAPSVAASGAITSPVAPYDESSPRPRYLRVNGQGTLVDAMRFPSVPESIVEKEVRNAETRRDAAKLLRRFGVNPNLDRGGEVTLMKASLVDGLDRERVLVVALFGEADVEGMRDEDDFIVFLASTEDERLIGLGSDVVSARTHVSAPIALDVRELHWSGGDDVVATWSSCGGTASPKACHGMRAWTLQRGYPERILDVVGDTTVTIGSEAAPPHRVATGLAALAFDPQAFAYR